MEENSVVAESNTQTKFNFVSLFHLSLRRWQELFLYFWVFSCIGHYGEVIASSLSLLPNWSPKMPTITPIAPPYGIGILALILVVIPISKRFKLGPLVVFAFSGIFMDIVELLCGATVTLFLGHNPFWDYSQSPDNIFGLTSLSNALVFGTFACVFIYFIYPFCEKMIHKISDRVLSIIVWVLVATYAIDLAHSATHTVWITYN